MRILAIGLRVYLGDLFLSLRRDGHDIRVFAAHAPAERAFGGLIDPIPDWRTELDWVGRDGLILFETVGQGAVQDALRAQGYQVIGGSALGDRLEGDRAFGQAALRQAGMASADAAAFATPAEAVAWLARHPGRYVLKYDDGAHSTFVGDHPAGADVAFMLRRPGRGVLLQRRLDGIEVGVGAYFNGDRFLMPACIDFEHKRFFPGELGEMTGEMGTLASYDHAGPLFDASLGRLAPVLAQAGHVGYVNLNLIAAADGLWPLELTCRFGNPGFAVLAALQRDGWGDLFARMLDRRMPGFRTVGGWSVAIVLTAPPFPHIDAASRPEDDIPIFFQSPPTADEAPYYHLVDVRQDGGQLFGRRRSGHLMIVTGTGASVQAAQQAARARARNVIAPELRWRADIGDRFLDGEATRLRQLGWLPDQAGPA